MSQTQDEKRALFEAGCKELVEKKIANFPLVTITINGVFARYKDSDTDSAWIGFCLGLYTAKKNPQ